jgi:hypothetical protein
MSIALNDLTMLVRNYARLEQAAARMFLDWAHQETNPEYHAILIEFSEIEKQQALALVLHLKELGGGELGSEPVPLEDAINAYLLQINQLPTLGERLRFNYDVMSVLERPVIMRALLSANPSTLDLFNRILNNEDRILGWCDETATHLGCDHVDISKYFGELRVSLTA